ncbi:hypothetical protein EVAR_42089_1 [Eumeta japonica]|uniref:Uncharacterized protein n=1 Tax=Eumeta variegata TaxID=151549 RepID=A0A4C1XJG8_EUMVA|nr:hypothetical protein EVAR_42089_1 [Eumeta japonica]
MSYFKDYEEIQVKILEVDDSDNKDVVDSRQRPAAHASAWRSGIGRQLTTTTTSPASAINLRQLCRRGRARRPREPTQAVLRACVLPNTRAVRRATRRAPDRPAIL